VGLFVSGVALAEASSVQIAWRLLDYIAVDYTEAVSEGKVINTAEYAEMQEFASSAKSRIDALPPHEGKAVLVEQGVALQAAIESKAAPQQVASLARALAAALLERYPVQLAPTTSPDLARGARLYSEYCSSCHGPMGDGHGPAAIGLDPAPIAFTDKARASQRSVFALYQVIEQGIDGTSMPSFGSLASQDLWALAFYAGTFAYPQDLVESGARLWKSDAALRQRTDLEKLIGTTPASLATSVGGEQADAITAYWRHHPEAVVATTPGSLSLARQRLAESLEAYARGERKVASDLALSAYLDGFEPVEPVLTARDSKLMVQIEAAMAALRADISEGVPAAEVNARAAALDTLFARAEAALAADRSSASADFVGAFTILLREGLEALLIVVAIIAFLRKADRKEQLPYVHGGWIVALVAGLATWVLATRVLAIGGASRELMEGFGSILAALVLLWVGIWMHGKSQAEAWQRYIREHVSRALSRGSAWFLFGLSFLVVYREVFETILFYAAIWEQGHNQAVLGGAASAVVVLAAVAAAMMRFSRKLPIGKFFAYSSILMAVLAVVLMGKGVSALQEAGYLPVSLLANVPRVDLLGISPTTESIAAQAGIALLLVVGFFYSGRTASHAK
jgi:high-affinity iron transporter